MKKTTITKLLTTLVLLFSSVCYLSAASTEESFDAEKFYGSMRNQFTLESLSLKTAAEAKEFIDSIEKFGSALRYLEMYWTWSMEVDAQTSQKLTQEAKNFIEENSRFIDKFHTFLTNGNYISDQAFYAAYIIGTSKKFKDNAVNADNVKAAKEVIQNFKKKYERVIDHYHQYLSKDIL